MKKLVSSLFALFGFLILLGSALFVSGLDQQGKGTPPGIGDLIDLPGLRQGGPDWRVLFQDLSEDKGRVRLSQSIWLMYFLHWRPLTEANRNLTMEYVRNHLLNFWGQAMNFELTNIDGEIEVCGHKAYFTEGSFGNGAVYTRFIVWNCPETNRQFTADCNINLRRKTPKDLLDLQRTITRTVSCHKNAPSPEVPAELTQKYQSEKWDVSFFIPPTWRTADYVSKDWFPQGMSAQSGSLWTLLTDSVKRLDLIWENDEGGLSSDAFNRFLEKCAAPFNFENVTSSIVNWRVTDVKEKGGVWAGEGFFDFHQKAQNQEAVSPFRFRAFLWEEGKTVYFLLASIIELKEFWNIPNNLSPSDETFERFIGEQVLPNIKRVPLAAYCVAKEYPQPVSDDPLNFLKETSHLDYSEPIFQETMDKILAPGMTREQKLERLYYFVRDGLPFTSSASLTASGVLKSGQALCYTKAMVFVSFCRRLGVPARLSGEYFVIKADTRLGLHRHGIAKIFIRGKWIYIDTVSNRDSWNYWGINPSVPFDPPEFSVDQDVVVGPEYYTGPTFEDYATDDVPEYWLRNMREYLERGRWPSYQPARSQKSLLKASSLVPPPEVHKFLEPGLCIDSQHPAILAKTGELTSRIADPVTKAKVLFEFVRDKIEEGYIGSVKASDVLSRGVGNCHEKAVLLAALGRAAGIPACFQFSDITIKDWKDRDGKSVTTRFLHGVTGFYLNGRWLTYEQTGNIKRWKIWVQEEPVTIRLPLEFSADHDVLFPCTARIMVKKLPLRFQDYDLEEYKRICLMCGIIP